MRAHTGAHLDHGAGLHPITRAGLYADYYQCQRPTSERPRCNLLLAEHRVERDGAQHAFRVTRIPLSTPMTGGCRAIAGAFWEDLRISDS